MLPIVSRRFTETAAKEPLTITLIYPRNELSQLEWGPQPVKILDHDPERVERGRVERMRRKSGLTAKGHVSKYKIPYQRRKEATYTTFVLRMGLPVSAR